MMTAILSAAAVILALLANAAAYSAGGTYGAQQQNRYVGISIITGALALIAMLFAGWFAQ